MYTNITQLQSNGDVIID